MIKGKGSVDYADGRRVEFVLFPIDLSRAERWLASHGLALNVDEPAKVATTHALLMAHAALQRAGDVNGLGFEPWADTVLDVNLQLVPADPTATPNSDG